MTTENAINWITVTSASPSLLIHGLSNWIDVYTNEVSRQQQYAELAGSESEYAIAQQRLSRLIGQLKRTHAKLGRMARHRHRWDENDYCSVCGVDGRA